jgi:hypothetical protein
VQDLIDHFGVCEEFTLIVGAGTSTEVGLADWGVLVRRLLMRVCDVQAPKMSQADRQAWAETMVTQYGYPGTGAMIDAMADGTIPGAPKVDIADWVKFELFGPSGVPHMVPGPTAREIARLAKAFSKRVTILTTNYDDLIELALKDEGLSVAVDADGSLVDWKPGDGPTDCVVHHLHGYAGRDGPLGTMVLTEEHYQNIQHGEAWQEKLVVNRLDNSCCLFIGTSLTDPNLVRYLHMSDATGKRHRAVFVRQSDESPEDDLVDPAPGPPAAARSLRYAALNARWARRGVAVRFVDHYGDIAQLLHEIGRRRMLDRKYVPVSQRAEEWIGTFDRTNVGRNGSNRFITGQIYLQEMLGYALDTACKVAELGGVSFKREHLGISLWLAHTHGCKLRLISSDDRVNLGAIMSVPIDEQSRWVSVQAFCRGVNHDRDRRIYASRWRYVIGLPLVIDNDDYGRLPVGCVTVNSVRSRKDSGFAKMSEQVQAGFNEAVLEGIRESLQQAV